MDDAIGSCSTKIFLLRPWVVKIKSYKKKIPTSKMKTGTKNKRLSIYFLSGLAFLVSSELVVVALADFTPSLSLHSADLLEQHL